MTDAPPVKTEDRDGLRTYEYPPTGELLDSVTTVIDATDSKPWLTGWSGGVSMAWAIDHITLLAQTLREKGRDAAIALGKDEAEKIRDIRADAGTYVHDVQERLILWAASPGRTGADIALPILPEHLQDALYHMGGDEYVPLTEVTDFMVDGFLQFVSDFDPDLQSTEMAVYHYELGVAGTLDTILVLHGYAICDDPTCANVGAHVIAKPGNDLALCVDTKTGKNPAGTWKEQLAAYRRMKECRPDKLSSELHPMPPTDAGAVLHLRPEYPDGYLLMLVAGQDDEAAWQRFQDAAGIFRGRKKVKAKPGKVIRALRGDGTMPGPRLCDLASEGYGHALAPLRKALGAETELTDLARFTAAEVLAVKGVGPARVDIIRTMLADHGLHLAGEKPEGRAA